jgi:pentatricopeptide repeat protein
MKQPKKYSWHIQRIGSKYACLCGNGDNLAAVKKEIAEARRDEKQDNGGYTTYVIRKWSDELGEYVELEKGGWNRHIPFHPPEKKEEDKTWIDRFADKFAGNTLGKRYFSCWCFNDKKAPESAWGVYHLATRDCRDCGQESNNAYILRALAKFYKGKRYRKGKNSTVFETSFTHWACGYIDVLCIQVYQKNGEYTKAFKVFAEMMEQLEEYPLLDEGDAWQREHDEGQARLYEEMKFHVRDVPKKQNIKALCREFCERYDPDSSDLYGNFPYEKLQKFVADKFSHLTT